MDGLVLAAEGLRAEAGAAQAEADAADMAGAWRWPWPCDGWGALQGGLHAARAASPCLLLPRAGASPGDAQGAADASAAVGAAEAAHAELATAVQHMSELLAELAGWRLYLSLEQRTAWWREEYERHEVRVRVCACT